MSLTAKQEKLQRKVLKAKETVDEYGLSIVADLVGGNTDIADIERSQDAWHLAAEIVDTIRWELNSLDLEEDSE